ncbi:hypothetical protein WHR41_02277 [Cladosporium halotolerans]|uniref:Uncharacterized protein n=1 Tax=Cladosporium halotolerans TaxID=1052096 RepID=A0AB34KZJ4_9PEZI
MSLTLGADGKTLYSMQSNAPSPTSKPTLITEPKDLTIHKTCPESALPMPTAYLSLPPPSTQQTATSPPATLFPHQAALDAIQAAATSPLASTIALTDPTGSSPAAARLAQNALAQAHSHHTSTIRRTTRSRSASGSLSATYALAHASLGSLPITVSPATTGSGPEARAKISLHHPRATPAALAAQTLALLTLDFGAGVAVLDTPGLLALDEPYVLDVAVAAVLAVAVLENEMVRREAVEFAPPPTRMIMAGKVVGGDHSEGKEGSNAGGKDVKKMKREEKKRRDRERGKEPGLVRETVSLVGMGVRGAVWLVGAGLKAARESAR